MYKKIEIMDTTLRDGEQCEGVSFTNIEKLSIAKKLLKDVNVDRIEIASARVSKGEKDACKEIFKWAKKNKMLERVEVLSFVDYEKSVNWVKEAGGRSINLLCKGSKNHCVKQLKKKPEEHFKDIEETIKYAKSKNFIVNVYLEDFSNGIKDSPKYVKDLIKVLVNSKVERVLLPDTLGILSPDETYKYVSKLVKEFPKQRIEFHAHNDYGLATSNSLAAVKAGVSGIHCTVNGLGERTGNAPLEEVVPALKDFSKVKLGINEENLSEISRLVEIFSRRRVPANKAIVGSNVFTQTAGIHADGDKKGGLYISNLSPKRFGKNTRYALGKLSGKASVELALREFGITLDQERLNKVLERVVELGDKKNPVTKEDLPFILGELEKSEFINPFKVKDFVISSTSLGAPSARIKISVNGDEIKSEARGDGGYDAFMNALKKALKEKKITLPELLDFEVRIPPGGKTDALVETKIIWKVNGNTFQTVGVSTDQIDAAIKATEKMVCLYLNYYS